MKHLKSKLLLGVVEVVDEASLENESTVFIVGFPNVKPVSITLFLNACCCSGGSIVLEAEFWKRSSSKDLFSYCPIVEMH